MRKEVGILTVLFLISIFAFAGVYATEAEQVENAYVCLEEQISTRTCADLTIEEKIFSVLSVGECKEELVQDTLLDGKCWSRLKSQSACDLETTAKAVLALDSVNMNTTLPKQWLLDQEGVSKDLDWFLQIDNSGSTGEMGCSILVPKQGTSFDPHDEYAFKIGEDKKISSDAGQCLTRANNEYWFKINEDCYDRTFQVSCDKGFLTTLVYKEKTSTTYHISDVVNTAAAGGDTTERVTSYCFLSGGVCNYLGSLWTTLALDSLNENILRFIPYLTTLAPSNPSAFPSPFLYILTNKLEYKTEILNKQKHIFDQYYWEIAGGRGKYYDTALALLPFQTINNLQEKENAKDWLLAYQGEEGCWDNKNLISTAFILYSIWPRGGGDYGGFSCAQVGFNCILSGETCSGMVRSEFSCSSGQICCDPTPIDGDETCSEQGNACVENNDACSSGIVTEGLCSGSKVCCDFPEGGEETECELEGFSCGFGSQCTGTLLPNLSCGPSLALKCCNDELAQTFCSDEDGEICSNQEYCSGGSTISTDDLLYGEKCCLEPGTCEPKVSDFTCEENLGFCSSSCDSGYEETNEFTCSGNQVCCINSTQPPSTGSYWWIWVLFFLVILVVVAVLYRDKIKEYLDKSRARRSGGNRPSMGGGLPPRYPPGYSRSPQMGSPMQRKMIPQANPRPVQRQIPKKSPQELDAVLKKLKEIGK